MNTFTNTKSIGTDCVADPHENALQVGPLSKQARDAVEAAGRRFDVLAQAPRSAATYIQANPQLTAGKTSLRIAVLGAQIQDIACEGCLYQLIPELIGVPSLKLDVELVGPNICPDFANVDLAAAIGLRPATCHEMSTSKWWKNLPKDRYPDVIFLFHPGMEEHHSKWMSSDELPRVLRSNIPVVIFSFDLDECQRDAYILAMHGAVVEQQPVATLDNLRIPKTGIADFGSAYFLVRGFKKNPANRVAEAMFSVENLAIAIGEGFIRNRVAMQHADMCKLQTILRNGVSSNVIHLVSDVYLDPAAEELFIARNGAERMGHKPVPAPGVAAALQMQHSDFARALLVGEIYGLSRFALL